MEMDGELEMLENQPKMGTPEYDAWLTDIARRHDSRHNRSDRMCGPVPMRYRGGLKTLGQIVRPDLIDRAEKWVEKFSTSDTAMTGFYISGDTGTGKTGLAMALALALADKGFLVECWTMTDLLLELRRSYAADAEYHEWDYVQALTNCHLLVLDDLGQELIREHAAQTLYTVVNKRYNDCKPMIVTSNLSGKGLLAEAEKKGLSQDYRRVISRFCEMLEGVKLTGSDRRKNAKD